MEIRKNEVLKYGMMFLFVFILGISNVSATQYENYFGINMTNEEYNNMLNLGFSEDEIYYMDLTTFNENKDLSANLVTKDTRYYKTTYPAYGIEGETVELTQEEFDRESQITTLTTVETTYKTMVTTMSESGSGFRYKVNLLWKILPSVRSYDIIGIGFNDDIYISSSVYMYYYYCDSSGNCTTSTQYYDKKSTSFGGSAVHKLPTSAKSLSSTLYFDVAKDTTATITSLSFCGDYSHATESVTTSEAASHSITSGGISLPSGVYSKYDSISCAITNWSGSW